MSTVYSNNYSLNPDGRTYTALNVPNNIRIGESVWVRGLVNVTGVDTCIIAPVSAGVRPMYGLITATATNGSLDGKLGYTSDDSALIAALGATIQSNTATLLTPAQIKAVAALPVAGDNLILTLSGTFSNATTVGIALLMVNVGS